MRITSRQLRRIIQEELAKSTKKYDDDSALRGDQSKLPDGLQKGIIDKTVEDREEREKEEREEKNESRITVRRLRRIIREELLSERYVASVSDLTHQKSVFNDWAEVLLDELAEVLPRGADIKDFKPKKRDRIINGVGDAAKSYLVGALGTPSDHYGMERDARAADASAAKRHRDRVMRGL